MKAVNTKFWDDMAELDRIADEAGGYVAFPRKYTEPHYDYRGLIAYCKGKGVEPLDLTVREYESFRIPDDDEKAS